MFRNDKVFAAIVALPIPITFAYLGASMAWDGYWVSPLFLAFTAPMAVRSVWRDRA